jgi:transposase
MTGRERRSFTAEFKTAAVRLVTEKHDSVREAAESLGIGENLVPRWKDKQAESADNAAETNGAGLQDELRRLRAENKRLLMEREILKKAAAFFAKESK